MLDKTVSGFATPAHAKLAEIMDPVGTSQDAFSDADGLISFVNMSSSFVQNNPEFKTGVTVCDKVSNYFATARQHVFAYLLKNPQDILAGDASPKTQWDPAVTHYLKYLLTNAGGLTNYSVTTETYSHSVVIQDFNADFVKLLFDAIVAPEAVVADAANFIAGVGNSLRTKWSDKSKHFQTAVLSQCHEAVPLSKTDKNAVYYYPKIKYYYLKIDSSQTEFTTPCTDTKVVTFNFQYEYYVTGFAAAVLNNTSKDYTDLVSFLDSAQAINHKMAQNKLNSIMDATSPGAPSGIVKSSGTKGELVGNLEEYPLIEAATPPVIHDVLNNV